MPFNTALLRIAGPASYCRFLAVAGARGAGAGGDAPRAATSTLRQLPTGRVGRRPPAWWQRGTSKQGGGRGGCAGRVWNFTAIRGIIIMGAHGAWA
jgi:hypothetical protein